MSVVTNGRYRCRGQDCIVLREASDGAVQVRWVGINAGMTTYVQRDEVEGLDPLPESDLEPMAMEDDSAVCWCLTEVKDECEPVMDPEMGMYVCGACGKPSRLALEEAAAREGIVW